MRVDRTDGFVLSDDKALLNLDRVFTWLSTDAYWALGRPRRIIENSIAGSDSYGVYGADGEQVAFSRVVTDRATFGWVCDVYVDRAYRGKGIGKWMIGALRDEYAAIGMRRLLLATFDAHGVYAAAGFVPLMNPDRWMETPYAGQGFGGPRAVSVSGSESASDAASASASVSGAAADAVSEAASER